MFTVSVETGFTASHQLTWRNGSKEVARDSCPERATSDESRVTKKEPLHCHNWAVIADVSSDRLDGLGLVMDFHRLKAMVDNIVAVLDNRCLEEFDYFQANNSSAENVAKYIYEQLAPRLPKGLNLDSIRVVEEPNYAAKYKIGQW